MEEWKSERLQKGFILSNSRDLKEFKECFSIPTVPLIIFTFGKYNNIDNWINYFNKNELPFELNEQLPDSNTIYEFMGIYGIDGNQFPIMTVEYQMRDEIYINRINEEGEYVFEEKEDGYLYPVVDMQPVYDDKKMTFLTLEELEEINFAQIFHERFGLEEYAVEEEEDEQS